MRGFVLTESKLSKFEGWRLWRHINDYDPQNILIMLFGLTVMVLFLFIDWREMLTNRNLRMTWQFWK